MNQFRITTGDGLNHIMNGSEKVMQKADIGIAKLWDEAVNKYHKCKKVYEEASPEEKEFYWIHPSNGD